MKDFETKTSEEQIQFSTGMKRDTSINKPRFDLIMPLNLPYEEQILTRWAKLMARGGDHYGARNWEKASTQEELDRFKESAFRHLIQWLCGEHDEDHAVAVFFNITGAEYVRDKLDQTKSLLVSSMEEAIKLGLVKIPTKPGLIHDDIIYSEFQETPRA